MLLSNSVYAAAADRRPLDGTIRDRLIVAMVGLLAATECISFRDQQRSACQAEVDG